jgi:hypothetical protein
MAEAGFIMRGFDTRSPHFYPLSYPQPHQMWVRPDCSPTLGVQRAASPFDADRSPIFGGRQPQSGVAVVRHTPASLLRRHREPHSFRLLGYAFLH